MWAFKNVMFLLLAIGFLAFACAVDENNGGGNASNTISGQEQSTIAVSSSSSSIVAAPVSSSVGIISSSSVSSSSSSVLTTGTVLAIYGGTGTITIASGSYTSTVSAVSSDGTSKTYTFEFVPAGTVSCVSTYNNVSTTQTAPLSAGDTLTFYVSFGYSNSSSSTANSSSSSSNTVSPLTVQVYDFPTNGTSTSNFGSPIGSSFNSNEINVPVKFFKDGFPGITDKFEYFGIKYSGSIKAPKSGTYTFILVCDDGVSMSIGGNAVTLSRIGSGDAYYPAKGIYAYVQDPKTIPGLKEYDGSTWLSTSFADKNQNKNSDSQHAPAIYKGIVTLTEGQAYDFALKYFQGPKYHIACFLQVVMPGESTVKIFSTGDFK